MFTRYQADPGPSALFTARVDGGGLKRLTPWGNRADDADFSPDGRKILFLQAREFGGDFGIGLATMNPSGTDRRFISSDPQEMHQPDWE